MELEKKICIALHSLSMVFIDFDFLLSLKCEQWQCQREKKVHSKKLLLLRHLWVTNRPRSGQYTLNSTTNPPTNRRLWWWLFAALVLVAKLTVAVGVFFFNSFGIWYVGRLQSTVDSCMPWAIVCKYFIGEIFSIHYRYKSFYRKSRSKAK